MGRDGGGRDGSVDEGGREWKKGRGEEDSKRRVSLVWGSKGEMGEFEEGYTKEKWDGCYMKGKGREGEKEAARDVLG